MKSGTGRKVQDPRPPAVDQQRLRKGEKRRQGRQKPSPVPAVHSEQGEPQRSRGSLPELHPDLWGGSSAGSHSPRLPSHISALSWNIMNVNKDVRYSDVISAGPGAVDVTLRSRESRICASSSETAVRTEVCVVS